MKSMTLQLIKAEGIEADSVAHVPYSIHAGAVAIKSIGVDIVR